MFGVAWLFCLLFGFGRAAAVNVSLDLLATARLVPCLLQNTVAFTKKNAHSADYRILS